MRDSQIHTVEPEFLRREFWDQLAPHEAYTVAQAVERCLPEPWKLTQVHTEQLGSQRRAVALFDHRGSSFALIPGGRANLGYDRSRIATATGAERQLWEYLGYRDDNDSSERWPMTPARTVDIAPFLLSVRTEEPPVIGQHPGERSDGFRLPTSDEWEYARSGGSEEIWPWGNAWGIRHIPEHEGASHMGFDPYVNDPGFDWHRRPNAFGLEYDANVFNYQDGSSLEYCFERDILRGYATVCHLNYDNCTDDTIRLDLAGTWLTFASAYINSVNGIGSIAIAAVSGSLGNIANDWRRRIRMRRLFPLPIH